MDDLALHELIGPAQRNARGIGDLALFSLLLVSHEITLRDGRVSGGAAMRLRPASGAWRRCGSRKFVGSGTDGRAFRAGGLLECAREPGLPR